VDEKNQLYNGCGVKTNKNQFGKHFLKFKRRIRKPVNDIQILFPQL